MTNEIQLVSDGYGLAVFGKPDAVERFLRGVGEWAASREMDLSGLKRLVDLAPDVMQTVSDVAASSSRWIKLTPQSARLAKEHGLMASKTPGVDHIMVGIPGKVGSWLQGEQGPGTILTNPDSLSGLANIMAQVAGQQHAAEITDYLARIDVKVDRVLAKVDDTVLKDLQGARFQIERAQTMQTFEGGVSDDSWSEVQSASGKIGDVQAYALDQLKALAESLESTTKIGGLAHVAEVTKAEARKWLAVLADCFRLQEMFDGLALDRALGGPPELLDARRRGLEANRQNRLGEIAQRTEALLVRMEVAFARANAKLVSSRTKATAVLESVDGAAAGVQTFHELLGIEVVPRSWERRQLGPVAELSAQAIQGSKDASPYVAATGVLVTGVLLKAKAESGKKA